MVSLGAGRRPPCVPRAFRLRVGSGLSATGSASFCAVRVRLYLFYLPRSLSWERRERLGCVVTPILQVKKLRITILLPCLVLSISQSNAFVWLVK